MNVGINSALSTGCATLWAHEPREHSRSAPPWLQKIEALARLPAASPPLHNAAHRYPRPQRSPSRPPASLNPFTALSADSQTSDSAASLPHPPECSPFQRMQVRSPRSSTSTTHQPTWASSSAVWFVREDSTSAGASEIPWGRIKATPSQA